MRVAVACDLRIAATIGTPEIDLGRAGRRRDPAFGPLVGLVDQLVFTGEMIDATGPSQVW